MIQFLVDAQLPYRLKEWIENRGYDVLHTLDLAQKNLTPDSNIADLATAEGRIVISKDIDFLKLNIIRNKPDRLLLITSGNLANDKLLALFEQNFDFLVQLYQNQANVIEMNEKFIVTHH